MNHAIELQRAGCTKDVVDDRRCLAAETRRKLERSVGDKLGIVDLSGLCLVDVELLEVWREFRCLENEVCPDTPPCPVWYLNLAHNRLQHFPSWLIEEVGETLRVLDLSHNHLASPLDGLELARLPELEVLSLAHNPQVQALPQTLITGLACTHPIRVIDLSYTGLKRIIGLCSMHTSNIRVVKLEYCDLEELPDSIRLWHRLWSLDLRGNARLRQLPLGIQVIAPSLRRLDVEGCEFMEKPLPARVRRALGGKHGVRTLVEWLGVQASSSSSSPSDAMQRDAASCV
jgi:hypothetical protein